MKNGEVMSLENAISLNSALTLGEGLASDWALASRAGLSLNEVMHIMLKPYDPKIRPPNPETRYLRKVDFYYPSIKGDFHIQESCYIKSTGHFNAVELIICYNQLAYTFFAYSAQEGLIGNYGEISIDDFQEFQLKKTLIARIDKVRFTGQINPQKFYGELNLKKTRKYKGSDFFKTSIKFWDDNKGKVSGEILLSRVP